MSTTKTAIDGKSVDKCSTSSNLNPATLSHHDCHSWYKHCQAVVSAWSMVHIESELIRSPLSLESHSLARPP